MTMDTFPRVDLERSKAILKQKLLRLMPEQGDYPAPFDGMTLYRRHSNDMGHQPIVYQPVIIVIAQGEKSVRIGSDEYTYGDSSYFVTGVDIPTACAVRGVSPEHPFLSLALNVDRSLIARLAAEIPPPEGVQESFSRGAMITRLDEGFMDAILRMVELVEHPEHAATLEPLLLRELHYRLLVGPFGKQLRSINSFGTPNNQIAQAILWLKTHFKQPLAVENLARQANMATSTFHKHFKEVTALSPLQFQKRLRLEQAQRLMLTQNVDASRAAREVGYDNLQQFTREYKRLFGEPPHRDIVKMRGRLAGA